MMLGVSFILPLLLSAAPLMAQQTADISPCGGKTVVGVWEIYDLFPGTEDLAGRNRYQAYRFLENGTFSRIANSAPIPREMLATFSKANIVSLDTYAIDKSGVMSMRFPGIATPDVASCSLTKKATETRLRGRVVRHGRGDMVLTYFDRSATARFQLYLKRAAVPGKANSEAKGR